MVTISLFTVTTRSFIFRSRMEIYKIPVSSSQIKTHGNAAGPKSGKVSFLRILKLICPEYDFCKQVFLTKAKCVETPPPPAPTRLINKWFVTSIG